MLPKGYYPEDVEEDVELPKRPRTASPLWRRALPVAVAIGALAGFSGLLLVTYFSTERSLGGPTPLIQADARPYKTRPADPGGLDVPHQNMEIFERVQPGLPPARAGEVAAARPVERLLPPPDSPLPRPVAAPPVLQPEIPASPVIVPPPDAIVIPTGPGRVAAPAQPSAPANPPLTLRQPNAGRDQVAVAPPAPPTPAPQAQPTLPASLPGFKVQLGTMRSSDAAEREWQRLQNNHGDLIGRLSAAYVPAGGNYRIHAGPLLTQAGAAQLCRRLTARGVGCLVVRP
jgi:hypothetical protein